MRYLRWLLFPFSLLYGLGVMVRNWFYDAGLFKSYRFKLPVISVGNLEVGGAGKSPMTEYLVRLLKDQYKIATLSRGYGRKTKGYLIAPDDHSPLPTPHSPINTLHSPLTTDHSPLTTDHSPLTAPHSPLAEQVGDEPAQFKNKFPVITVAVCEDRVFGITRLAPDHDLILMDDAYQHRAVEPGLNILLFDYSRLKEPRLLLPAGNYREPFSGRWRSQVMIITKCPPEIDAAEQASLLQKITPLPYQQLFFTSISYQGLQDMNGKPAELSVTTDTTVFLLTGITNARPLLQYLKQKTPLVIHHQYPDHHAFTLKNITKLAGEYAACKSQKKIIITTEKDARRLEGSWLSGLFPGMERPPVFVIPISVVFLNNGGPQFNQLVIDYVREHSKNNSLH